MLLRLFSRPAQRPLSTIESFAIDSCALASFAAASAVLASLALHGKDDVLRLTAHPAYWRGVQRTERLVDAISPAPNVRVQKLGQCMSTVSAALQQALEERP